MNLEELYSREKFNEMKDSLGLTNKDLSDIVGLKPGTVKNQVSPHSKKISTWMRAFLYMWDRQKQLEDEITQTDALNVQLIRDNKESIAKKAKQVRVPIEEEK